MLSYSGLCGIIEKKRGFMPILVAVGIFLTLWILDP